MRNNLDVKENKISRMFRFTEKQNKFLKLKAKTFYGVSVSVQTYITSVLFKKGWEKEYEEMEKNYVDDSK